MTELEVAKTAALAGGQIVERYFRDGVAMRSNDLSYNLVSDADVEAEAAIVRVIKEAYPDHHVLAEESHRDDAAAEHLWVIDPLDGTANFAHHMDYFSVSIAYCRAGRPHSAVVYHPLLKDWYTASRGQGAFLNDKPVQVAAHAALDQALIAVGFYYPRGPMVDATLAAVGDLLRERIHGIRRLGSAALDLGHVGAGHLGAYFEYELAPWDFAAGWLFVEEAGGRVTDCRGEPLQVAQSSVLATNGLIHDAMLEIIRPRMNFEC